MRVNKLVLSDACVMLPADVVVLQWLCLYVESAGGSVSGAKWSTHAISESSGPTSLQHSRILSSLELIRWDGHAAT